MENRPTASDVARIDQHLTQIIVAGDGVDGIHLYSDGQPIFTSTVESLTIEIFAPDAEWPDGRVTGILSRYETDAAGEKKQTASSLFPGTVDIIARGRRMTFSCPNPGSVDGLWVGLGLRPDGTSDGLTGVSHVRVLLMAGLLDTKLRWEDGQEEVILP